MTSFINVKVEKHINRNNSKLGIHKNKNNISLISIKCLYKLWGVGEYVRKAEEQDKTLMAALDVFQSDSNCRGSWSYPLDQRAHARKSVELRL